MGKKLKKIFFMNFFLILLTFSCELVIFWPFFDTYSFTKIIGTDDLILGFKDF